MNRVYIFIVLLLLVACNKSKDQSDAYGNFEAVETTISSEANGKLISLNLEEGQSLKSGLPVGIIDTVDTQLKLEQLEAQINSINSKSDEL